MFQIMHHGCCGVLCESDYAGSSKHTLAYLKMERSCSLIVWCKPPWRQPKNITGSGCKNKKYHNMYCS